MDRAGSDQPGGGWGRAGGFRLDRAGYVVITEGPSDGLAAVGLEYAAVAIRGAALAATSGRARRSLVDVFDELCGRDVVVAGDGDEASRRFSVNVAASLAGGARSVIAALPDGLDLAAVVHRQGVDAARALVEGAEDGRRCLDAGELEDGGWLRDTRGRWLRPADARRAQRRLEGVASAQGPAATLARGSERPSALADEETPYTGAAA